MRLPRSRVLCIDQDISSLEWIEQTLTSHGVVSSVSAVRSGRQAFDLLVNGHFDLCITEYALPDMTGVQLCALVRQIGCDVPVVLFTAMNRPVDRENAARVGASEFLAKPDDMDIFPNAVAHMLGRRRSVYAPSFQRTQLAKAA